MIRGQVNARRQPCISVEVGDGDGDFQWVEAIVDTGFNGHLTLPLAVILQLGLELDTLSTVTLATGLQEVVNTWNGYVRWHNRLRHIVVLETSGNPLLGTRLLDGSQLTVQMRVNGEVVIEELDAF